MSETQIGVVAIVGLFVAIGLRIPIAIALIVISSTGIAMILGLAPTLGLLKSVPYEFAADWALSSVPTFLVMGYVCHHANITSGLFRAAKLWLSALPGGLAIATIFASAGFSAMSGSSVACAAAMGRIAVPEMVRHGYSVRLSVGTVAAAGTLGPLIPPSILLILYGIFVQQPIGKLFLGGLAMGILTVLAYTIVVMTWATLVPDVAPRFEKKPTFQERMESLRETMPALILVVVVFGGMFVGIFTPSEAGAVGATFSVIVGFARKGLTLTGLRKALEEAMTTTCVVFLIAIGASLLVRLLALSGTDQLISDTIVAFEPSRFELFLIIGGLYVLLGMFLEPVGTMLLTVPILYPVLDTANIDLLWFGVILIKFLEIGMLTPPVGLNVYVIKSVVGRLCDTWTIFRAVAVFLIADAFIIIFAMSFPNVILYFTTLVD